MQLEIYDQLLQDAYNKGYTDHKAALVFIDKDNTFKIQQHNSKELILGTHYQNADNNYMYSRYFHLMIVIQIQYDLLFENTDELLTQLCYYYSLKCGILGFENTSLYKDVDKYCKVLKPKIWANLNG